MNYFNIENVSFIFGFLFSTFIFSIPVYFIVPKMYTLALMHHEYHTLTWEYPEAVLYTFGLFAVASTVKHFVS